MTDNQPMPGDPEWHRLRTCLGKRRFATLAEANKAIAAKSGKRQKLGKYSNSETSYRCQYCHGIHTGHTDQRWPRKEPIRTIKQRRKETR